MLSAAIPGKHSKNWVDFFFADHENYKAYIIGDLNGKTIKFARLALAISRTGLRT